MYEIIKTLCQQHGTNITALCELVTGSSGNLATWKKGYMRSDYLNSVAVYFNVSTDYLLGREQPTANSNIQLTDEELRMLSAFRKLSHDAKLVEIGRVELLAEQEHAKQTVEKVG